MQKQSLRDIQSLKNNHFIVPHYQRGYRWGEYEVRSLLKDIWDFILAKENDKENSDFYCLQPVVVKKNDNKYLLIDGQQRLTTIFMIIKFLKNEDLFRIEYQTRRNSIEFLENIQSKTESQAKNIDFYHFFKAYENIKGFFENNKTVNKNKFIETLLKSCKVLWYEIKSKEDEINVFIRLNIGKIPLKEVENVKALFLSKNNELDDEDLKGRANDWHNSEVGARENSDFRYCVLSKINENNIENKVLKDDILRIEAYLKAIVPHSSEEHYLFDYFYKHYKNKTLDNEYENLISAINTLSGFVSGKGNHEVDREIFHYLGFLILSGENIHTLYSQWKEYKDKQKFSEALLRLIQSKMSKIKDLKSLEYKKDKQTLQNILLLFNLEYLIRDENSNEYFKFNRFVLERWSLEHIYAQNSQSIKEFVTNKDNDKIIEWLEETMQYIEDDELKCEIKTCIGDNNFKPALFDRIDDNFKNSETMHNLQNLTLLDKSSNSKIGNKIFSQKRKEIQKLDEQDKLIPIATKKVFEKLFSKDGRNLNRDIFDKNDQKDYLNVIKEYLQKYMKE